MKNRTGNYVAFDGCGETDPTKSDMKYYAMFQAWADNNSHDFSFVNSHEKTSAVLDSSLSETLKSRINERLSLSKNMIIILSDKTRKSGSMLSYEIEKAVDLYKLPLIIVYAGYDVVLKPDELSSYWPTELKKRIENSTAKAIHIPLVQRMILSNIKSVDLDNMPASSLAHCDSDEHDLAPGELSLLGQTRNRVKKSS